MTDLCRDTPEGCELEVQVVPRASRTRIVGVHDGRVRIQLAAPPVDGAANQALVDLLADVLAVTRSAVAVVRGHTGKRKTVRVAGLAAAELRALLGLPALLSPLLLAAPETLRVAGLAILLPPLLLAAPACESESPFAVRVVLPDDTDALMRADNAALELTPGGATNFDVDGLEFSLEVKLEPDDVQRTLALYLAEGETLLAWGRSAPFVLSSPPEDLAVLIAPPGRLSSFRGTITEPDPHILVGVAPGRGAAAFYVTRADGDAGEGVALIGGDDPALPLGFFATADATSGTPFGPKEAWTGLQCLPLDLAAGAEEEVRVLCIGGMRGGATTTAALLLHFPADSADNAPDLEILTDLVPDAPADPRLLSDDHSLYAQYTGPDGGQWLRIDRQDLTIAAEPGPALRARGGHSVSLGTGATFLLGGWTADDQPVDRWHVFVPTLTSE
jgi:uncharacterized protein (TIGR00251 family)